MDMEIEVAAAIDSLVGGPASSPMAIGGAYEGASQMDRALAMWSPPLQSADADIIPQKSMADARVRDLQRNDGLAQAGRAIHQNSIVGSLYMLNSKPELKILGLDETWAEEMQEEVEAKFTLGAESVNCWLDASRSMTFTAMIRTAIAVYAGSGEVAASVEWLRSRDRPFKTAIQLIDIDRIRTPYTMMGDRNVKGGVRVDRYGAPIGYYVRESMDWGLLNGNMVDDTAYIPARKPWGRYQFIHIREQTRPHQTRGVADMVAGLKETRIAKKFRDITLQNAVTGAMFAASVESELPTEAVYAQLGAGNVDIGKAISSYGTKYLEAVAKYSGAKGVQIDGVKIPHLVPGTKLNLRPVGTPGGVGQEFEQSLIRHLAALLGVSYEQLSRDYSKTNYSSMKGGLNETWKFMQARKKMVADRLATIIYMLWFEEMVNAGQIEAMKYSKAPNMYDPLMMEAYTQCEWIGAARGQIDELKETQAALLRLKGGLSTYEEELGKMGKDWRKVFIQLERERADMEARGLTPIEDNALNAASGSPREDNTTEAQDA